MENGSRGALNANHDAAIADRQQSSAGGMRCAVPSSVETPVAGLGLPAVTGSPSSAQVPPPVFAVPGAETNGSNLPSAGSDTSAEGLLNAVSQACAPAAVISPTAAPGPSAIPAVPGRGSSTRDGGTNPSSRTFPAAHEWTEARKQQLRDLADAGVSITRMARELGMSHHSVRRHAKRFGIDVLDYHRRATAGPTAEQVAHLRALAADGESAKAIGRAMGVHESTVVRFAAMHAVDLTLYQRRHNAGAALLREHYATTTDMAGLFEAYRAARGKPIAMSGMTSHASALGIRRDPSVKHNGPKTGWLERLTELVAEGHTVKDMARLLRRKKTTVGHQVRALGLTVQPEKVAAFAAADAILRKHYETEMSKHEIYALYIAARGPGSTLNTMCKRATDMGLRRPLSVTGWDKTRLETVQAELEADAKRFQAALDSGLSRNAAMDATGVRTRRYQRMKEQGLVTLPVRVKVAKAPRPRRIRAPMPSKPAAPRAKPASWVRAEVAAPPPPPKPQTVEEWLAAGGRIKALPAAAVAVTTATISAEDAEMIRAHRAKMDAELAAHGGNRWMQARANAMAARRARA